MFITIYIICGLSDILDGYIARKTHTESTLGAKIDSIADLVMFTVITSVMIIWIGDQISTFLPQIVAVVFIRLINLLYTKYKYHTFASIHTWGNKITGLLIFTIPIVFVISHSSSIVTIVLVISIISAVEESVIHFTSKTIDLDRISIFKAKSTTGR